MNDSIQANAMHRIPVCCNHNCNEGRECPVRADYAALHDRDGSATVSDGVGVHTDLAEQETWQWIADMKSAAITVIGCLALAIVFLLVLALAAGAGR